MRPNADRKCAAILRPAHALLREKFTLCAQRALRKDAVDAIADSIERIETLPRMEALMALIASAAID